ncbi:MAG: IclR family transcriptional regulator [Actinobacteria bacterium]|nr:IclR family transcriptional regulator [Actinomycetota bacterium]
MAEKGPNSIEKALEILLAFTPYNQEMGTGEIGDKLGLHKATASRILNTLEQKGFLQRNPETRKFSLGPAAADVGRAYSNGLSANLVHLAKPYLDALRNRLGETVVLEILTGAGTVMAYVAEGPQRVRIAGTVGDRLPVHAAAGSKAVLAFSPPELVDKFLAGDMPRLTPNTITDPALFRKELAQVRRRGYALDREEIDVGINAVGAPVFDHCGEAIAAVVVAGPAQRITGKGDSQVVVRVKKTAEEISRRLGHRGGGKR